MVSTMMSIQPAETIIVGKWTLENGKLVADTVAQRIDHLIKNELTELGISSDGWSVLYLDKRDSRYWELNYPNSSAHGGGAPCLTVLSRDEAVEKFKILG
ncbi:Imm27 family immunity protein [Pseudomonas sp. 10B1]|uniref:Imm27 family immunity protein n=1 Tax=unclassified Pseudomonas TaxID=196821 RepID=UPI002AB4E7EE|nr:MULTISPECIES: Imm27 family immunity protein [unclassified Pseudomonas]MDY7560887.1 Imm27 family immunity protein [Pseudomonas sp. AB6]MEA9997423.1 Imm27 family immunity protein [Pseudomonas sp. AA4]MEB0089541.1 Imm27 family immunity protein [Pseudomonas sp. RTI1]MEB0128609.1 Imm27 family immunity protein [Pseudomonas sp. CCC1.2]MEB0155965.1 Imm27 family immunity protein [Pseudomonas sp. CCC4.3]